MSKDAIMYSVTIRRLVHIGYKESNGITNSLTDLMEGEIIIYDNVYPHRIVKYMEEREMFPRYIGMEFLGRFYFLDEYQFKIENRIKLFNFSID